MGKRGPAPKPSSQVSDSIRRRRKGQPTTVAAHDHVQAPPMPRGMPQYARDEWHKLVPMLENRGLITQLDQRAMERYVRSLARLRDFNNMYDREASSLPFSELKVLLAEIRAETRLVNDLAKAFGLSPAERARITTETKEPAPKAKKQPRKLAIMQKPAKQA